MPRNRELMRVFRDMELVEQIGSGLSRILRVYDRSVFEFSPSFTVVTFLFEKAFSLANGATSGEVKVAVKTTLDVIRDYPDATVQRLAELAGKSHRTLARELKEYQLAGRLYREGSRKNGRWIVKDDGGGGQ